MLNDEPEPFWTVTCAAPPGRTWPQTVAVRRPRGRSTQNGFGKLLRAGLALPSKKYRPDCQPPYFVGVRRAC